MGGNSAAAHRRTARYGDVFYPVFSSPAAVGEQWAAVRAACEQEERDPAEVSLSLRLRLRLGRESDDVGSLRGIADAVVEQIGGYAAVGVSHMTLDIARGVVWRGRLRRWRSSASMCEGNSTELVPGRERQEGAGNGLRGARLAGCPLYPPPLHCSARRWKTSRSASHSA